MTTLSNLVFIIILFTLLSCNSIKIKEKVLLNASSLIDDDLSERSHRYTNKGRLVEERIFNKYNIKDNYIFIQFTCARIDYKVEEDGELLYGDCPKLEYILIFEEDTSNNFNVKVYENNNYKNYLEKYLGNFDLNYSKVTKQFLVDFFSNNIENKSKRTYIDNEFRININFKGNKFTESFEKGQMLSTELYSKDTSVELINRSVKYYKDRNNIFWFLEQISSEILILDYLSTSSE